MSVRGQTVQSGIYVLIVVLNELFSTCAHQAIYGASVICDAGFYECVRWGNVRMECCRSAPEYPGTNEWKAGKYCGYNAVGMWRAL
jgi:hypothetical protein